MTADFAQTVNAVGIGSSAWLERKVKNLNKIKASGLLKIVSLSSLQETAFLYIGDMKTKQQKTVQAEIKIERETEKAVLADFGSGKGGIMWLPKSQITIANGIVTMPAWLFRAKLMDKQTAYNNLTSDQKAQNAGYRSAAHFMSTQNH